MSDAQAASGVNGPTGTLMDGLVSGVMSGFHEGGLVSSVRVARQDECPHCFRQRHPEPLTLQQAQMYDNHKFDAGYDAESDDSKLVCIGSDYEGPRDHLAPVTYTEVSWSSSSVTHVLSAATAVWTTIGDSVTAIWQSDDSLKTEAWTWLAFDEPKQLEPVYTDCLPIVYNDPNNWKPWEKSWYPLTPALDLKWQEWMQTFPAPESPGYDFEAIKNQVEGYTYHEVKGNT